MFGFLSRHKGLVVVGALLLLPAVILFAQTRRGGARGPVVGAILDVSGVVQRAMLWATGGLGDALDHYLMSVNSWDELSRLRREKSEHARLETRLEELSIENERLRALANAAAVVDGPRPLGARVIGRTGQPLARLITIDRGRRHSVRRGDPVISSDGVVGVVLAVGYATSDVLLLTDPTSAIDIVVQRSRARGIVRGRGDDDKYAAVVEDFDRLRDVQVGDALVTSGIGARFPVGMLVGFIVDVDERDDLTMRALVRPAVDFSRLEHVSVLVGRELPKAPPLGVMEDGGAEPPRKVIKRGKKPRARVGGVAGGAGAAVAANAEDTAEDTAEGAPGTSAKPEGSDAPDGVEESAADTSDSPGGDADDDTTDGAESDGETDFDVVDAGVKSIIPPPDAGPGRGDAGKNGAPGEKRDGGTPSPTKPDAGQPGAPPGPKPQASVDAGAQP